MIRPIAYLISRPSRHAGTARGGFTLVELLVVIAIIAMLMGLLIPAVQRAREAGRRAQCMNNQQQLGKAVVGYATAKDRFPPGFSIHPATITNPLATKVCMGWVVPMLPYIEQNALYQQIQSNAAVVNTQFPNMKPDISNLVCPSRGPVGTTVGYAPLSYVVNAGMPDSYTGATASIPLDWQENGVFFDHFTPKAVANKGQPITTDLAYISKNDGTSMTVMLSENLDAQDWLGASVMSTANAYMPTGLYPAEGNTWWQGIVWYLPNNPSATWPGPVRKLNQAVGSYGPGIDDTELAKPSSNHPGGFLMTMCDAHTIFVSEDIEYRVYALVMAPNSGKAAIPGSPAAPPTSPYPTSAGTWIDATGGLIPIFEADLTK